MASWHSVEHDSQARGGLSEVGPRRGSPRRGESGGWVGLGLEGISPQRSRMLEKVTATVVFTT
jgi:hypothetical protein